MLLLTVAPSPSLCGLAKTFFTTILGLSNGEPWPDADIVILLAVNLWRKTKTEDLGLALVTGFV